MKRFFLLLLVFLLPVVINAQHQPFIDVKTGSFDITVDPYKKKIQGTVTYKIYIKETVSTIRFDAREMSIDSVLINETLGEKNHSGNFVEVSGEFKKGTTIHIAIAYRINPKNGVYFIGWGNENEINQVWTQGQGKYTSTWLPSFDDMSEKIIFNSKISFLKNYTVASNGVLVSKTNTKTHTVWEHKMVQPMSSYLLAFAIGKYAVDSLSSASGIPIYNYYPTNHLAARSTTYKDTKTIFTILENEIGVSYPWQNYKQIPVRDFLYAGMENTGTTIFSDTYLTDTIAAYDTDFTNVSAHELAHQWFGNLVTEHDGNHHWLHEGFATYFAYMAELQLKDPDEVYGKLHASSIALSDTTVAQYALNNPKANSLTFYEKGAWALVALKDKIGSATFKKGIQSYLKTYAFSNATITDFFAIMEEVSGERLDDFQSKWISNKTFPTRDAKTLLAMQSSSFRAFYNFQKSNTLKDLNSSELISFFKKATPTIQTLLLNTYHAYFSTEFLNYYYPLATISIKKEILTILSQSNPAEVDKHIFISALEDTSYILNEMGLLQLWKHYPEERENYMNKTSAIQHPQFKILWLLLAAHTNSYSTAEKSRFAQELFTYTSSSFPMDIRMLAMQTLNESMGFSKGSVYDILEACVHHSWQFKKYARSLTSELIKNPEYLGYIQELQPTLPLKINTFLNTIVPIK